MSSFRSAEPTNSFFEYDRAHPPLFFDKPENAQEALAWAQSMRNVKKTYFKMIRGEEHVGCNVVLPNGTSAGEYAMYLILNDLLKRL